MKKNHLCDKRSCHQNLFLFLSISLPVIILGLSSALMAEPKHEGKLDPGAWWPKKLPMVEVEQMAKSPQEELQADAEKIKFDHIEETRIDQREKAKIDQYLNEEFKGTNAEEENPETTKDQLEQEVPVRKSPPETGHDLTE